MTLTTNPAPTSTSTSAGTSAGTSDPAGTFQPAGPQTGERRSGLIVLVALIVAAALATGLFLGRAGGGSPSGSPAVAGPATTAVADPGAGREPSGSQPSGSQGGSQDAGPAPQPQPQTQPGVLSVGPSVIDLASGDWTAEFTVSNLGSSDMSWFAVGVPSNVGLSAVKGTLAAGEETTVTATVDHTTLAKGPFSLTLHVSANDTAQAVTINGTKQIKVNVPPGPGDLKPNS